MDYGSRNQSEDTHGRSWFWIVLIVVILLIVAVSNVLGGSGRKMSATKLRCTAGQSVTAFGDRVLYYDGMTLYCLSSGNRELWSYAVGDGARFSCTDQNVVVWVGSQLSIINKNGTPTYNENLSDVVQFARPGTRYVGVVLGADESPSLMIKDMQGTTVDSVVTPLVNKMILDLDFFGNGEYFWVTTLDVYGTVPSTMISTYCVNQKMASGEASMGEYLVYDVVFAGDKLNVITTRELKKYEYNCTTKDTTGTLVYGWRLCDSKAYGSNAMLLFTLDSDTSVNGTLRQLRLIYGSTDKRYTLPSVCVGAALYNRRVYAFSQDNVYYADINDQRFKPLSLQTVFSRTIVEGYLGMLSNGTALLYCSDDSVYAVTLP